jgi:pimeloyl-ACP methyl ester carboxylesterase
LAYDAVLVIQLASLSALKQICSMNKHRVFWLIFIGGMLFFAGVVVWYVQRALTPYPLAGNALEALASSPLVQVSETSYGWVFVPQGRARGGLAFYPGGLVQPQAYAPVLHRIASAGYRVALLRVRYNLAVTEPDKARSPLVEAPDLPWAVGGHSLGGVVASNFADHNPQIMALVMWAAYPQFNLSAMELPSLALYGEKDGVINPEQVAASRNKFPRGTLHQTIPGLNHAGFGAYSGQRGDNPATITPQAGWDEVARRTVAFLDTALAKP